MKTALMDNFAKREANTCTPRGVRHQTAMRKLVAGRMPREWLTQRLTPEMAVSQSDESNHSAEACFGTRAPMNFCPISFDGSVVDYRGNNGYGELGFDSGEGA